jgi:Zn-dependent protease/CBS domain-containing protein
MGSFTAGRIAGIPVRISASWFIALAVSTGIMGLRIYPALLPATPDGARWALAFATSIAFFLSILLHELGHALVARRFDVPVASITLFLLGGVAQITREVKRPLAELLIAAAGPLTSLALGGLCLLPALLAPRHHRSYAYELALHPHAGPLIVTSAWLGVLNLSVGIFNLIPGFPMDGGRVLRAVIWACGASYRVATRIACFGGRIVAVLCIGLGILAALHVLPGRAWEMGPLNALWLVLIGFYLDRTDRQSQAAQQILDRLGRLSAAELMLREVPIVRAGARLRDFLPELLAQRDCEAAFVADDEDDEGGRMVGLVLRGRAMTVPAHDRDRLTAADLMLPADGMLPAAPDDDGASLLQRLEAEGLAAVPVVAGGEVLGLIGRASLFRYAMERRGSR